MSKTMPKHGILGFLIILISQLLILTRAPFFFDYYFPIIWLGYIFLVDGLVQWLKGKSILENKTEFIKLFVISVIFWFIFELITVLVYNFEYITTYRFSDVKYMIMSALSFSTVLPAIVETTDLVNALGIFKSRRRKRGLKLKKAVLYSISVFGFLLFLVPIFQRELLFPIVWVMFFFILDPINYINKQPSIIKDIVQKDFEVPLSLILAGLICGFFWEFWNYWSYVKWSFMVPFFDYYRLFELRILGYVGLFFFTLELFAMYHFVRFVIKKVQKNVKIPIKMDFIKKIKKSK